MKQFIFIGTFLLATFSHAMPEDIGPVSPPREGNFAHDQLPFTTFSFGQNIFDKNTFLIYPFFSQCVGKNFSEVELLPAFLYAFTDSFSLYVELPLILKDKSDGVTRRGIGNLFAQCEYALIEHSSLEAESLVTVVGGIEFPTTHLSVAHDCIQTDTNYTATGFFLGTTVSRLSEKLYVYASTGATFYMEKHGVRSGTSIAYEWGIGSNLGVTKFFTFTGILEFSGIYTLKDSVNHCKDCDTGGNILFVGPSLSITGDWLVLTGGIQWPLIQSLNGEQDKTKYKSAFQLAISF